MNENEALKLALSNAAGLINNMDLEQLYGDGFVRELEMELLTEAQRRVVRMLQQKAATIGA